MCAEELARSPMCAELARSLYAHGASEEPQLWTSARKYVYGGVFTFIRQTVTVTVTVTVKDVRSLGEIRIVRAEHVIAEVKSR